MEYLSAYVDSLFGKNTFILTAILKYLIFTYNVLLLVAIVVLFIKVPLSFLVSSEAFSSSM